MIEYLEGFQGQVKEALGIGKKFARTHKFRPMQNILFCALGGSAMSGDILSRLAFGNEKYPFQVSRIDILPKWVNRNTLVILSSYSGNTQEVLDIFRQAVKSKAQILVVTSGGKLKKLAGKHKLPTIQIPAGLPPRCAVGYLTFAVIPVLRKGKIIQVSETELKETEKMLNKSPRSKAKKIARELVGRTIRLYGVTGALDSVIVRWRAQIAENSKLIVSSCLLPEMFHNEIEGWQVPKKEIRKTTAVFFTDKGDSRGIESKRKIARKVIQKCGAKVMSIGSEGRSPLTRIFSLIYLGDWVSYELALLHRVNPLKIPAIDAIKKA